MRFVCRIPLLLIAVLTVPQAALTQETTWTAVRQSSPGWIGFYYTFANIGSGSGERTVVVITDVVKDSPAEAAGLQVGDTLTHLDGQPISSEVFSSLAETLEPGDMVPMTVIRGGRPSEIMVEAAHRPTQVLIRRPDAAEMVIRLDALKGDILKDLDSLRLSISDLRLDTLSESDVRLQILRMPGDSGEEGQIGFHFQIGRPFVDDPELEPDFLLSTPEFSLPFAAYVVDSPEASQLKEELSKIRKDLTQLRREALARQRELAASIQGPIEEILRRDERIQDLRRQEEELLQQQEQLTQRLRHVSEEEMYRQWAEVQSRSEEAFLRARRAQEEAEVRNREQIREIEERARGIYEFQRQEFRSPVIVGQSFVLGAQLAPLNPDLGEYVQVDEGVFVVQVMKDTPAFEAGLRGGDVIVRVAGEDVATLSDLRFGLATFTEGPVRIRVIRKGSPLELQLRR